MKAIAWYQVKSITFSYYDCTDGNYFCEKGVNEIFGKPLQIGDKVLIYLRKIPGTRKITFEDFDDDMFVVQAPSGRREYLFKNKVKEIFENFPASEEWNIWVRVVRSKS